jgi:hypothetical protein
MATWKSPIFSDIRNKLGENVVFSMWKGRTYMRSYVKPSNPNTLAQTANRLDMTRLVEHWQGVIAVIPADVTLWNKAALSDLISGYNRFVKGARGYVFGIVALAAASFEISVISSKLPLNDLRLYAYDLTGPAVIPANKQTLGSYTAADFTGWTPAAGDYLVLVDEAAAGDTEITTTTCFEFGSQVCFVDEVMGACTPIVVTN